MGDAIVSKYGGSSITSNKDITRIANITNEDKRRKIIIVSAPGKRDKEDIKVTDLLIELAKTKNQELIPKIIGRYVELSPFKKHSHLEDILKLRFKQGLPEAAYLDSLKAFGEEACAKIVAEELGAEYIDPKELFLVTSDFGRAEILPESEDMIKHAIKKEIKNDCVFVMPGFYGYTAEGLIATLSRGGSDLTAAYVAASVEALVYENFTDRAGVFAADPNLVENPHKIDMLTFEEIRDLAYLGFTIFHEEAMIPVERKMIPVHIRKTMSYPSEGTHIVYDRISDPKKPIVGVAYKEGFCSFSISRFGLNGKLGIMRQILSVFEDVGLNPEFASSSIDDITLILREEQCLGKQTIGNLTKNIRLLLGNDVSTYLQEHLGCLVVAGKGLKGRVGISSEIQSILANAGVNIKFILQGSRERSIVYGISSLDGKKAVNAIYNAYLR